jgi:hypothetical protein
MGLGSEIRDPEGQKGTGSRIRIRNIAILSRKLTVHAASSPVAGHVNTTMESASAAETPFREAGQRIEGLQAGSRRQLY